MQALGADYQTVHVSRSETANQVDIDFEAATGFGPADAVLVNIVGADRELILWPQAGGSSTQFTVKDGRSPFFDYRVTSLRVNAGTSAKIEVFAFYRDRWTPA